MPVFSLSIHANYRCRHSGACCTAGWHIPAEAAVERAVDDPSRFERSGRLTIVRHTEAGACTFFEPGSGGVPHLCAIHRALGPESMPSACRHFPRVAVIDRRGVHVTLSHFCPTAASLLFDGGPLAIVEEPPAFADAREWEGLDAREALPPLLRPGMLMDLDGYASWEQHAVAVLAGAGAPESAVAVLAGDAARLATWTPSQGPLDEHVRRLATDDGAEAATWAGATDVARLAAAYGLVASCAEAGVPVRRPPGDLARLDADFVEPAWPSLEAPLRHYLAAKAFASWVAWQARDGLPAVVRSLDVALAVVRVEAARQCGLAGRRLDRTSLAEAIRQADLLLVHEVSRETLAAGLDEWR